MTRNRKTSTPKPTSKPKSAPKLKAVAPIEHEEAKRDRILQEYVSGKRLPVGPHMQYVVSQLQKTMAEGEALSKNIGQAEQQLGQMRKGLIELQGAVHQAAETLIHFHEESQTPGAP